MSNQKTDDTTKHTQTIVHSIVGASICCYFEPRYTVYFVLGGIICICTYGIISILKKYENIEEMNFIEKEKVEYFKTKK